MARMTKFQEQFRTRVVEMSEFAIKNPILGDPMDKPGYRYSFWVTLRTNRYLLLHITVEPKAGSLEDFRWHLTTQMHNEDGSKRRVVEMFAGERKFVRSIVEMICYFAFETKYTDPVSCDGHISHFYYELNREQIGEILFQNEIRIEKQKLAA